MNENQQIEVLQPETSALELIERAQYDVAVSTAHKYPRDIQSFHRDAIALVKSDQETAESCIFRRPVGKKNGREEYAEGMSIRMAEIVAACYGNIVYGSMIIAQTERQVTARGQARDIQRNVTASSEVVESTVTKEGKPFSERMRIVVAKSALAKARRDALFQVVPRALCKPIETAARQVITGSSKPLDQRRAAVQGWILKTGLDEKRVWTALGIASVAELNDDQLIELQGIRTAIKEGEMTIDDAFPAPKASEAFPPVVRNPPSPEKEVAPPDPAAGVSSSSTVTFIQAPPDQSPQETLASLVVDEWGFTFAEFIGAITELGEGWLMKPETIDAFQDIPNANCAKILGAKRGLQKAIEAFRAKGGAK